MEQTSKKSKIAIFNYDNYRNYLKDIFEDYKNNYPFFSHRYFSKKAGFSSSNFALLVISGKRNLSKESVLKFSAFFKLNTNEHDYFENLVFFNQSKTLDEKNYYFTKISSQKKYKEVRKLEKLEFDYFNKWYIPVIREMIDLKNFKNDPEWISRKINPKIKLSEAKEAIEILLKLNLIIEKDKKLFKVDKSITTGEEIRNIALKNLHKQLINLAGESIERFLPEKRDISALTLSVTSQQFLEIKKRIIAFRKEILELVTSDSDSDLIYQLNLQLFPLADTGNND